MNVFFFSILFLNCSLKLNWKLLPFSTKCFSFLFLIYVQSYLLFFLQFSLPHFFALFCLDLFSINECFLHFPSLPELFIKNKIENCLTLLSRMKEVVMKGRLCGRYYGAGGSVRNQEQYACPGQPSLTFSWLSAAGAPCSICITAQHIILYIVNNINTDCLTDY